MKKPDVMKFIKSVRASASKHSPEILTAIGIAGMVTTTILAVKATPKALKMIDDVKQEEQKDELTPVETVKAAWKPYIPAVVTGAASIACLIGSNSVHTKRNAALMTAYKISETALTEYKEKVVETIGEKKEKNIRDSINKDKLEKNPVSKSEVIITERGNTLCYDVHSDRYFRSDIDKIRKAVNELNYRMTSGMEMYVSLNEFYDAIGLSHTPVGDELGWLVSDGMIDIHYGAQMAENDQPCIVIEHLTPPKYGFNKLY